MAFVLFLFLTVLTPSSKTVAAMIILPRVVENEQVRNITDNSLRVLEKLTAEWVHDMAEVDEPEKGE